MKSCSECGVDMGRDGIDRTYCGSTCRSRAYKKRVFGDAKKPGISPGDSGAAHEMFVCADLLKRGYSVYRSVSPSASVDLIVFKGASMLRVEVTTGARSLVDGSLRPPNTKLDHQALGRFDVLAIVEWKDSAITYLRNNEPWNP